MIDSSCIHFTRALEHGEFMGAFRCLYRSYQRRGLIACPRVQQLRLTRYHLLPETRVFIARTRSRIIGTLSLIEDRPLGVPLRSIFDAEVNEITSREPCIAEAGCLAIDPSSAVDGVYVVHHLMGLAAQAAARRGMTRIVVAVHPRHAAFYERVAGFKRFAGPAPHPSVAGAPALALQLDLRGSREENPLVWQRYFGMQFSSLALSDRLATTQFTRRMARLWQSLYERELEAPGPAAATKPRLRGDRSIERTGLRVRGGVADGRAAYDDRYEYATSAAS
ncbi:MAG: hypothetical protein IT424_09570 [Pirellulales bacterium]|nr:hypothetical protein [Pirellulales bacterium]